MAHKKSSKTAKRAASRPTTKAVARTASSTRPAIAGSQPTAAATSAKTPLKHLARFLPWILIIGGIIGIIASYAITLDKFELATNPNFQPICDLNPIISCGSVMKSKQANAFGFMNTYIGLIGFPVILTMGVAMLAGARFKRWFWLGAQAGLTFGFIFAYWLLFESMYRIRALCPWCLSVDVAITTIFWYLTLYNFYAGNLRVPERLRTAGRFIKRHHADILVLWFLIIIAEILHHFWYYFGQRI
ncbi:MAG TPA: vitamin K epoxide reductase family protein [Candidatus Saccharimonadales bacterium]|nr:vitamin K epoxide reductase family protein [Candidatus Saccharimonadales bacterium]